MKPSSWKTAIYLAQTCLLGGAAVHAEKPNVLLLLVDEGGGGGAPRSLGNRGPAHYFR